MRPAWILEEPGGEEPGGVLFRVPLFLIVRLGRVCLPLQVTSVNDVARDRSSATATSA